MAAIVPDSESSGWLRTDFTLSAWENFEGKEQVFSHWKTIYKAPVPEEKTTMSKESPETLLRRLMDEDLEHTEKARFILAVMLERQKILRETDTQKVPSGILRVYEHRKDGDVFLIKDPNIALDQVEKIQDDIIALIEGGGEKALAAVEESITHPSSEPVENP